MSDTDEPDPEDAEQVTATFGDVAEPIVPDPFDTEHVWPDGFVFTVTAYAAPDASDVANVNGPFADTDRSSPPLSCSTTAPDKPDTEPPTEYVGVVVQVTPTLVTLADPIVPEPFDTVQVWPDGFVFTVTAYAAPTPTWSRT